MNPNSESSQPRILIVDDDSELRGLVAKLLEANGYRVTEARDGNCFWEAMKAAPDLVILDVMLPGEQSGLDLCRELRKTSATPVIMLTAKGEEADRVVGLELGADDYLAKPFGSRELLARVRAVLRRSVTRSERRPEAGRAKFRFEGWVLDPARRELFNPDGVLIDLSAGEYDLLLAFVEAPQRVLHREELLDATRHGPEAGFDRTIDVQISRLRKKIDVERAASMIKTVRGAGYMFLPVVDS